MKQLKKIPKVILTLLLVIVLAFTASVQVVGAADGGKRYISEVKLGYGETAEDASKQLIAEGYTILSEGDAYVDLNEGGSSTNKLMRKGAAIVYLGYKTTDNAEEAITDLATMNMKGGYSFADYQKLIEEHQEQIIKPFIEKFMGTVKEYRENYNGDNADNKAKATVIHDMLNKITDDDTGMGMGDFFLAETKGELGDAYDKLSDAEKKQHGDLVTVLMQGQGSIVMFMEQLLSTAADTADNTWLDRFLVLGTDGLAKQFTDGGMTPSDAQKEMAAQYGDTAKAIADKWEYLRSVLMELRDSAEGQELLSADDEEGEDAGEEIGSQDRTEEEIKAEYEEPLEGELDAETESKIENIGDFETVEEALESAVTVMESTTEVIEGVSEANDSLLFLSLFSTSYGEGSLLDFFLQPASEVSGDNLSKLYPIAAALSEGQKSGLDFLSLEQLLRIGITDNAVYESVGSQLEEMLGDLSSVSVYEGVNRELFSDGVALTSEALRKNPNNASIFNEDTLGISVVLNSVLAAGAIVTGVAFAVTLRSALKGIERTVTQFQKIEVTARTVETCHRVAGQLEEIKKLCSSMDDLNFHITPSTDSGTFIIKAQAPGGIVIEGVPKFGIPLQETDSIDDVITKLKTAKESSQTKVTYVTETATAWGKYALAGVFFVAMAALSAYTIYNTYQEMSAYYHQEMTKIPKYIVDEVDITTVDEEGNKTFVRNDTAYYEVALCNRTAASADYPAMKDYGDLNGDVAKQWLALYFLRSGSEPILADSFTVVKGKTDLPEGYEKGIHMIGEKSAVNMTDSKYTYNDKMNGIYVYYKTDASATSKAETASVFGTGIAVAIGAGCLVIGLVLGALIASRMKKKKETAA